LFQKIRLFPEKTAPVHTQNSKAAPKDSLAKKIHQTGNWNADSSTSAGFVRHPAGPRDGCLPTFRVPL